MTETSKENNRALENLNNKLLEIFDHRGIRATFSMSLSSKVTNTEKSSQFKLVNDPDSNRVHDVSMNKKKHQLL